MKKKTTKPAVKKAAPVAPVAPRKNANVAASPNHGSQPKSKKRIVTKAERARRRLIERYGFAEDELKTLFKSDQDLLDFYNNIAASEIDDETEKAVGWDMTDAMDAPVDDKKRFQDQRLEAQKRKYEALKVQAAAAKVAGTAAGPQAATPAVPTAHSVPNAEGPGSVAPTDSLSPVPPSAAEKADLARLGISMDEFLKAGDDIDQLMSDEEG